MAHNLSDGKYSSSETKPSSLRYNSSSARFAKLH